MLGKIKNHFGQGLKRCRAKTQERQSTMAQEIPKTILQKDASLSRLMKDASWLRLRKDASWARLKKDSSLAWLKEDASRTTQFKIRVCIALNFFITNM